MELGDSIHSSKQWYGIRTKSNFEIITAKSLESKGYLPYLPIYRGVSSSSKGSIRKERPLFPGYVFCRFDSRQTLPIMRTPGVVSIVAFGKKLAPIPENEIEAVRAVLAAGADIKEATVFEDGQSVRVTRGPLTGVEGMLLKRKGSCRMIISVAIVQRAISVEIDRDSVEPVWTAPQAAAQLLEGMQVCQGRQAS